MSPKHILLTFDVEDWFQVENLRPWNPPATWHQRELRVEKSTHQVLDLLDSISIRQTASSRKSWNHGGVRAVEPDSIQATFFILGWVARRCPDLVKEIRSRGHEVASHGDLHLLCASMSCAELDHDLAESKKILEDLIGQEIAGYRAPSFSISEPILKRIQDAGYAYDSSYNSFALHHRYGRMDFGQPLVRNGLAFQAGEGFFEIPVSNLTWGKKVLPWGGGGYFRIIPSLLFRWGVRKILHSQGGYMLYVHPWEFDPGQPRVKDVSWQYGFRHYVNLDKTETKLKKLISSFGYCRFVSCSEYLRVQGLLG
jgi:polysaccharide deacetylase family protein (PEP-CTERM system associated)